MFITSLLSVWGVAGLDGWMDGESLKNNQAVEVKKKLEKAGILPETKSLVWFRNWKYGLDH